MHDLELLAERLESVLEALERIPRRFAGISRPEDFRASADGIDRMDDAWEVVLPELVIEPES
jgi:hypothetical protein